MRRLAAIAAAALSLLAAAPAGAQVPPPPRTCTAGVTGFVDGRLRVFGLPWRTREEWGADHYACIGRGARPQAVGFEYSNTGTGTDDTPAYALGGGRYLAAYHYTDGEGGPSASISLLDLRARRRAGFVNVVCCEGDPAFLVGADGTMAAIEPGEGLWIKRPGGRPRTYNDGVPRDLAMAGGTVYWREGAQARSAVLPGLGGADIDTLCTEAAEHRFAAVCVNPVWVAHCAARLAGTGVEVATVIGFPLGANESQIKAAEAARAVDQGATEIDMVAAIGHIKSNDWDHVGRDISAVVAGAKGKLVKVIIESAVLTPVEIIKASALAKECGARYVKTSTGFHSAGGASAEAVALMRMVVGDALGVKASGGVRDCGVALKMIANGATRIGTSSGVSMAECLGRGPLPVHELISMAESHNATCATCRVSGQPDASRSAY